MIPVEIWIIGGMLTMLGLVAIRAEWIARRNRRTLADAEFALQGALEDAAQRHNDLKRLPKGSSTGAHLEEMIIASGGIGQSIFSIYNATEDHEAFLTALQKRLPGRFGSTQNPMQWASQLISYGQTDGRSFKGLVSNWVGQIAEDEAVDHLNSLAHIQENGYSAELHQSLTHPGSDIRIVANDGTVIDEIQCKSYGSKSDFMQQVRSYEESGEEVDHYIVNREVYQELESSGQLQELAADGIRVDEGPWLHGDLVEQVNEVADSFHEAADVAGQVDDIAGFRWVGTAVRTMVRTKRLTEGKTTVEEAGVDTAADVAGVAARGVTAAAAGKAGAAIGTAILPGVGTIIGGIGGAIGGAVAGGYIPGILRDIADSFKYDTVRAVLNTLGKEYYSLALSGMASMKNTVRRSIYQFLGGEYFDAQVTSQQHLLTRYEAPRIYTRNLSFDAAGLVVSTCLKEYRWAQACGKRASDAILRDLNKHVFGRGNDACYGFLGEVAAANAEVLIPPSMGFDRLLGEYRAESRKFPNHPFRIRPEDNSEPVDTQEYFSGLCDERFDAELERDPPPQYPVSGWVKAAIALMVLFWLAIAGVAVASASFSSTEQPDEVQGSTPEMEVEAPPPAPAKPKPKPKPKAKPEPKPEPEPVVEAPLSPRIVEVSFATIDVASARCRAEASRKSRRIRSHARGSVLPVIGKKDGWLKLSNGEGPPCWVLGRLLQEGTWTFEAPPNQKSFELATVTVGGLRCRKSPEKGTNIHASLDEGHISPILEENGEWSQLLLGPEEKCWVATRLIAMTSVALSE